MSRHDSDLDTLIQVARAERPQKRWMAQRKAFRRLGLGGAAALLFARISFALGPPARAPRLALGAAGLLVAAAVLGGAYAATPEPAPAQARDEGGRVVHASPAATGVEEGSDAVPPSIPMLSVDALPSAPKRAPSTSATPTRERPRDEEDDLARETASVSKIRSLLAAHDFSGALAGVREHRRVFARGHLGQEVTVLEIEAHQGLGDGERACSVGRAFLDAHPTSAHRTRVSGLVRTCK